MKEQKPQPQKTKQEWYDFFYEAGFLMAKIEELKAELKKPEKKT